MNTIVISVDEAREMVWGDSDLWRTIETKIVDTSRWSIINEGVFHNKALDKYFRASWSIGATECQDERPFEGETSVTLTEVVQKEVLVKQWVTKE